MLNKAYAAVKDFQQVLLPWSMPPNDMPRLLDKNRAAERYKFLIEESDEFLEAATVVDQADAMIDLIYFALGTLVEMGVEPDELFKIVHEANMNKLQPDGTVLFNEDDKVVKPEGWEDPEPKLQKAIGGQAFRKKALTISHKVKGNHFVTGVKGPPR